ncbi:MAG: hypothetical protein IPG75_00190 [Gemmatimonadetes bacterium]|nr:hypothetical protein [Gemmatimonadota bacterium]
MSQSRLTPADGSLPPELELAFSPLHKRAFGLAVGAALGLLIAGFTLIYVLRAKPGDLPEMALLRSYFLGYTPTLPGAIIGGLWGLFVGFVGGWFFAFCRNFAVALSVFIIRAKAELNQSRDFLDHI